MEKKPERRGLGRGLSALMADASIPAERSNAETADIATNPDRLVPIESVRPNPEQPRRVFRQQDLDSLSESIREKGILQPLIVREDPLDSAFFQIVAGERRWRAAQMVQLHEVPVLVRTLSDTESLEIAIIENIQRADLNPVEEAQGYRQLMDKFGHTQEKLSQALGKSRSHIANMLRLMSLPEAILGHLENGEISTGHARALITAEEPIGLCQKVIAKGLSVRETERLAKKNDSEPKRKPRRSKLEKDADTKALELDLAATVGMPVSIDHVEGTEKGAITIRYTSLEQLDDLCRRLNS